MSRPDGGLAFPGGRWDGRTVDQLGHPVATPDGGMTLRDYFAAKALNGMMASTDRAEREEMRLRGVTFDTLARIAYDAADAMLAERSKP